MNLHLYDDVSHATNMYWFVSHGRETVIKVMIFRPTPEEEHYEMVPADLNADGSIDAEMRRNNGDTKLVLSTAARAIAFFLSDHPRLKVIIESGKESKIRLYQMAIASELHHLGDCLEVHGFDGEHFESFQPGRNCQKFIACLKP